MAIKEPGDVSDAVKDQITHLMTQLKGDQHSHNLMERFFSPEECKRANKYILKARKQRNKDDAARATTKGGTPTAEDGYMPHAVHILANVRQLHFVVATIELGFMVKYICPQDYHWLRSQIGIDETDFSVGVLQAMDEADLVLDEYRRTAFWMGKQIDIEFLKADKLWGYFWQLAKAASNGCPISPRNFGASTSARKLTDWKNKLTSPGAFPADLQDCISVNEGRHRLGLPSKKINVFPNDPSNLPVAIA